MSVELAHAALTISPGEVAGLTSTEVYAAFGTSAAGLSSVDAGVRLAESGPNTISVAVSSRLLPRLAANFVHVMAILLWVGGAVAFAAGLPELGVAIWVVNVVNGVFSFWQEHKAERATEALMRLLPITATVMRDGSPEKVDAATLVPGDVVLIEEGDRIPADGRLVEHVSLRVDQSMLTGESRPIRKASEPVDATAMTRLEIPNVVHTGTTVAAGRGRLVVTATGPATEFGRIATLTQSMTSMPSPLQRELRHVSVTVSVIAVTVGAAFYVLALALGGLSATRGFVFALGMIVAFVPEGLLPTVTLSLAMGTQRMAARNALVKRLSSVETLGCTTVICTDKTGTLTQNEMTVRLAMVGARTYEFGGVGYAPLGAVTPPADDRLGLLLSTAALASNARLTEDGDGAVPRWRVVGDATEGAVLVAAVKGGVDLVALSAGCPRVLEVPFDSGRKRMSTINRIGEELAVSTKGAPAELLERCTTWQGPDGSQPLGDADRGVVNLRLDAAAGDGLRVLGVARRVLAAMPMPGEDVEVDLEFLGLLAMHDPPRPEVADAISKCRSAGIRIIMITGDYGVTAEAIGRRVGMTGATPTRVVNGEELDRMTDQELAAILEDEVIFARAAPTHKLRIVAALQSLSGVVAVTGDGVNDAPALKKADIGVAMGVTGTDVAKEAADIILLDDNFASIVAAIEEGRAVYDNIKKFTTYILTSNTPEAVPFVVFAFSGGRVPIALDVMHILAIDLGTDLAPALALGAERPEPGVMDRPPRALDSHLIDRKLLTRAYLWLGPLQAAFVMAAFFGAFWLAGLRGFGDLPSSGPVYNSATAMALGAVVSTQIGNLFAQRSHQVPLRRMGFGGNRLIWWGIASELVVIALVVYLPGLRDAIGTAPFPPIGWLWLLAGIPLLPIADEVRKVVGARRRRK